MYHALSAIDHALRGDPGGLSYLEQTASIYVFDAATAQPKIYGWWNFLNDALNEVERYETVRAMEGAAHYPTYQPYQPHQQYQHFQQQHQHTHPHPQPNLDSHVRLLATISRRVARRPPSSDRRLVGTCLSNASMSHMHMLASAEMSRSLIRSNDEMRERDMGRIAAIVFDFSFHRRLNVSNVATNRSAFSDPVVMEQLCGAVAANAVSTGPDAVRFLVSDWIVPSVSSLPPFAVVSILSQIAIEAMGKGCPAGTKKSISSLVPSVLQHALGPLLIDALRESEQGGRSDAMVETNGVGEVTGENLNQRIAALDLSALNSWCKAASIGMVQLRHIFHSTQINILEAIADSLYSDSEHVIDSVGDLLETLLQRDSKDATVALGLSIAESVMKNSMQGHGLHQLLLAQQITGDNERARISALSEFVTAIGLQRFRFSERQSVGDTAVCRCLTRISSLILLEVQDLMKNGTLPVSPDGLVDLLFKAVSHSSVYVCGISLEALSSFVPSDRDQSVRLLPLLQGKAIIPVHLTGGGDGTSASLDDYNNFRERILADALNACYDGCGTFYLESCASAIEEFCSATPSPHLPCQLEAALFCMVVVSEKVSNEILSAHKANSSSMTDTSSTDTQNVCAQLEKIINALTKDSFSASSNFFAISKMCRFVNVYARCFPLCEPNNIFESASELALSLFKLTLTSYSDDESMESSDNITPLSEACSALQSLLCSSPANFASPSAMSALESAWKMPYSSSQITIEDREVLCSGLCYVIASLPPEQWYPSLENLANPILACLESATKETEKSCSSGDADMDEQEEDDSLSLTNNLSNEIRLLAAIVQFFNQADASQKLANGGVSIARRNALVSLLEKSWTGLSQVGSKYSSHECVAESLSRLLINSLSLCGSDEEFPLLIELTSVAKTSIAMVSESKNQSSLAPMISFVQKLIDSHGNKAESAGGGGPNDSIRDIISNLMLMSYDAVRSCSVPRMRNGSNGAAQDHIDSPDLVTPMFHTLSSCATKCPRLLVSLSSKEHPAGEIVRSSMKAAPEMMRANEVEVACISIEYLKKLFMSLESLSSKELEGSLKPVILSVKDNTNHVMRTNVMASAVASVCGSSPWEVLDPMADLLQLILTHSQWEDVKDAVLSSLSGDWFKLGDEARSVVLEAFNKCTVSKYAPASFGSMIVDIWNMHQTDDTGSIAGGEVVLEFVNKYSSLKPLSKR